MRPLSCPIGWLLVGLLSLSTTARAEEEDEDRQYPHLSSPPVVSNGRVFFVHDDGKQVIAVDPARQARAWTWSAPAGTTAATLVALDAPRLLVVRTASTSLALDQATGRTRWTLPCTGEVLSTAAVVIVRCPTGPRAVSATQGTPLWQRTVPAGTLLLVLLADGVPLLVEGGSLAGVDATTGKPVWTVTVPRHARWVVGGTTLYGFGTPAPPGKATTHAAAAAPVTAFDLVRHRKLWSRSFPRIDELVPAGERLVLGLSRGVQAVRARDGRQLWSYSAPRTPFTVNPTDLRVLPASDLVVFVERRAGEANYYEMEMGLSLATGKRRFERHHAGGDYDEVLGLSFHGGHVITVMKSGAGIQIWVHAARPGAEKDTWLATLGYFPSLPAHVIAGDVLHLRDHQARLWAVDLLTGKERTVLPPARAPAR